MSGESNADAGQPGEVTGEGLPLTTHHSPLAKRTTHTIRLRDFWTTTTDDAGRTRHARNFGRPRLSDPTERVWLVCESVPGPVEVFVNDRSAGALPAAGSFAADVTDLLQPRNAVVFAVASDLPLGAVAIEIRAASN